MDYGHELMFGVFLTPSAAGHRRLLELARQADQAGLDLVTVQDHPYQPAHLDAWTALSVIAASTERVRVSPNVANLPLRPPAMLAKQAASLDLLSGGRVELGLGAGAFWTPIAAMGGPRRGPGEAVAALAEAIEILRAMWRGGETGVRFAGEHYVVDGAKPGPVPAHEIGIWLGAYKPRMLELTGRLADGWLPSQAYAGIDELPRLNAAIDRSAQAAGRAPAAIRRLYNLSGELPAERLAELALVHGMSGFILAGDDPDAIRRFALDVAPAVRELVAQGRGTRTGAEATAPGTAGLSGTAALWDESTRPTGPAPDPARRLTAEERARGHHLVEVHDHLRAELEQVRALMERVLSGTLDAGTARSHLNALTLRQHGWTLGAYCAAFCRVVTTHHTLEDAAMLPGLRQADPRLGPVLDRLAEEHAAIHGAIDRMDRALVAFVTDPAGAVALRRSVDLVSEALRSHLSYEERELVEPLSRIRLW